MNDLPVFVWEKSEILTKDGQWHLCIGSGRTPIDDDYLSFGYYETLCGKRISAGEATAHFPIGSIHKRCQEEHDASNQEASPRTTD